MEVFTHKFGLMHDNGRTTMELTFFAFEKLEQHAAWNIASMHLANPSHWQIIEFSN